MFAGQCVVPEDFKESRRFPPQGCMITRRTRRIAQRLLASASLAAGLGFASAQTPTITSIVNSASAATDVAEASIASIVGENLSADACVAIVIPYPQDLCGVSVTADGQKLPLLYTSPTLIYLQMPYGTGTHNLMVKNGGQASTSTPVNVKPQAPGVFVYNTANPDGTTNAKNLAIGLLDEATLQSPTTPVWPGKNTLTLYVNGLGKSTDAGQLPLGMTAPLSPPLHTAGVQVYVNGTQLPSSSVTFAGYAPTLIIDEVAITPPDNLPTGANSVKICAGDVCSPEVTVFMTNTRDYLAGNISSPGTMSDGKDRKLESIVGFANGQPMNVNKDGNYLVPVQGTVDISLAASSDWESYKDTFTANGSTVAPTIKAFPHVVYTDVKGDYDRNAHGVVECSYIYPPTQQWRGTPGGGDVTLLDMVHYMATNGTNPSCAEIVDMWMRYDEPLKIYFDPTGQPFFDPVTGGNTMQFPSDNPISGVEILWNELVQHAAAQHFNVSINLFFNLSTEHGINFKFEDPEKMAGFGGLTAAYPFAIDETACSPIIGASMTIDRTSGSRIGVAAVGRHELLSRAVGYGASGPLSLFFLTTWQ